MRPLSLTLRAFGSYAGELRVDFARLAHHGIFCISGPTGAGKSTIFDALVYALYDDLPGFRVDGNVRSQFADPAVETEVSLEFEVHGERWRVDRRPTQLVARRRGEGAPVERTSTVVLGRVGPDGELLPGSGCTKKAEVGRRIDELVGLTKEQFEQVVLIPQGRFEEVLKAETGKRAPLLRRLFPVEVFGRVTESLRTIAASRQATFDDAARGYDGVVDRLREAYDAACALVPGDAGDGEGAAAAGFDVDRLPHHLDRLGRALAALDGRLGTAASELEDARRRRDAATQALADWTAWRADVALAASFAAEEAQDTGEATTLERARRLVDLRRALEEWSEAGQRLGVLEAERAALVSAVDAGWIEGYAADALVDGRKASVLAERLGADADALDKELARFDRLAASAGVLATHRTRLEDRRVGLAERALKLDAEEQAISLMDEEVERLRASASGLEVLVLTLGVLERERDQAMRRDAASAELSRLEDRLAQSAAAARAATAAADAVRASWRDGVAGRLAQLLQDGDPCPTCGALEHPAPAMATDGAPDDETLAEAERARDAALEAWRSVQSQVADARGELRALDGVRLLDEIQIELDARCGEVAAAREASRRLAIADAEVARRHEALRETRARLEEDGRSLAIESARLAADESAHERGTAEFVADHGTFSSPAPRAGACRALASDVARLAEVLTKLESAASARRQCETVLTPVAEELGVAGPEALFEWVVDPADLEARALALESRRSRREDVRRRIAEHEARAGATERPDLAPLEAAVGAATRAHVVLVERSTLLAEKVAVLAGGAAALDEGRHSVAVARRALEQAKTVADQCAGFGAASAAVRLSLENWVLADYLRQVLVQANHRLDTMTDGRYALRLSEGVTDGRKPWGLDLSVFDANTGQVRPATTLSGGETFMAALALALGLADVVSGGSNREIGALFVDEGFGSLDPQSLDAVIDVLRSLEDGGRIVGVISHVADLKQALPTGITVEPSPRGSIATLHYPPG